MSGLETTFLMGMFALPVAAIAILVVIGITDYKYSKKRKYFHSLIEISKEKNGIPFTKQRGKPTDLSVGWIA
jgi:hypothetical protein